MTLAGALLITVPLYAKLAAIAMELGDKSSIVSPKVVYQSLGITVVSLVRFLVVASNGFLNLGTADGEIM